MSGGALNYVYTTVENAAGDILSRLHYLGDTERRARYRAFAKHLDLIATALHDIEWVMSSDYGEDGADDAIAAVISEKRVLSMLLDDARELTGLIKRLNAAIGVNHE
jgi:hypothetical protein